MGSGDSGSIKGVLELWEVLGCLRGSIQGALGGYWLVVWEGGEYWRGLKGL